MIPTGLTWLISSILLFVGVLLITKAEQKRGSRFLLVKLRGHLDGFVTRVELWSRRSWDHFTRHVLQLGWYYGLHSFLQAVLKTIVAFYERVEHLFEHNRRRTKELRAEKREASSQNHLSEMAQHKADTALTPAQERKLKARQLKGD